MYWWYQGSSHILVPSQQGTGWICSSRQPQTMHAYYFDSEFYRVVTRYSWDYLFNVSLCRYRFEYGRRPLWQVENRARAVRWTHIESTHRGGGGWGRLDFHFRRLLPMVWTTDRMFWQISGIEWKNTEAIHKQSLLQSLLTYLDQVYIVNKPGLARIRWAA